MPTVNATPGDSAANSYVTLNEAEGYAETRLHASAWNNATTEDKERAIIQATRLLDAAFEWKGAATSDTQALSWPRTGLYTKDGYQIAGNVLPMRLKDATSEFAIHLLAEDRMADNDARRQGLESLKAGPVTLEFRDTIAAEDEDGTDIIIPQVVKRFLVPAWYTVATPAFEFKAL